MTEEVIIETKKFINVNRKQPIPSELKGKTNYHFINLIRFISMIGIVSFHSLVLPRDTSTNEFIHQISYPGIYIAFISTMRFSIISFCMISGYLLAGKLEKQNKRIIYLDRCSKTLKPYIISVLISAIIFITIRVLHKQDTYYPTFFYDLIFNSPYWFVPMSLVAIFLLLVVLKLQVRHQFIILFSLLSFITLKYVYVEQEIQTTPVFSFGFVFYFWLGILIWRRNWIERINKINPLFLISIFILSFLLNNLEAFYIWKSNLANVTNNLRITNQMYSVICFVMLVRISKYFKKFSFFNPRTETFGIYLYHSLVGVIGFGILKRLISHYNITINFKLSILLTCAHFIFTYTFTLILVKLLLRRQLFYLNDKSNCEKLANKFSVSSINPFNIKKTFYS